MPSVKLSPIFNNQIVKTTGVPAAGWKIRTYQAGSSTPLATYTDSTGSVAQTNPIDLDSLGFPETGQIWLAVGLAYKLELTDENGIVKKTQDYVTGVNDASITAGNQWVSSALAPTYVSATSFTLAGDQTTDFHVGRRLQFAVTAGTVYGVITGSSFASSTTTLTVEMDNGQALDSGLTAVNLSILRADKLALPSNKQNSGSRVIGLLGNVNSGTPLTKFDLSADGAVFRDANGWAYAFQSSISSKTCDLGLAGPAANGRDQSAAFTASSWIHLYKIYDPSTNTVATLASTTAPTSFTGSTLPSGYTMWAYATSIRWNGSSNIIPVDVRGCEVIYSTDAATIRVIANGVATVMTSISCASFVPPTALKAQINLGLYATGTIGNEVILSVRRTGSGVTGNDAIFSSYNSSGLVRSSNAVWLALGASQQFDYKVNIAPTGGGALADVLSYTIPNGDA